MKYAYFLLITLLIAGCRQRASIEFTGNMPGITSGVVIIKNLRDSTVYGENIKNEKFAIPKKQLKETGYYTISISEDNARQNNTVPFEIYLENGKYNIETQAGKLSKYPKITSPSKIQDELSVYYNLADKYFDEAQSEVARLNSEIQSKGAELSKDDFNHLLAKLSAAQASKAGNAFADFVKLYPNSEITAHLMSKLNYEDDPARYYALYKTLSPAAKNSDEGKEIGDRLNHLIKLVVGAKAPPIYGKMPNGKPFDQKAITKKFILVDFWRPGNDFSRRNHEKLINLLTHDLVKNNLEIVTVSLGTSTEWWTSGIIADHMTWLQVSDLKGDDSPNAVNWSITSIPTYYLLDKNWNIVERKIDIGNVYFEVGDYIWKHK